jgi:N4-gp56 family major capsid protein
MAANDYVSGAMWSSTLPSWQRTYYEGLLLETLRTKSILVPFCTVKEDFRARDTGVLVYSEVYDTDPNYNPLSESSIWMKGAYLDSRSITLGLEVHGDTLKFSDYSDIVQYVNNGDLRGLVKDKIGQNQRDMMDLLCRNAFLEHPNKIFGGGLRAAREDILATDLFDPDFGELARTHLEEAEIPGITGTNDGDGQVIACVTTPRVIHDIRTAAGSNWLEVNQYVGTTRKFTSEVGTWAGVRYIRTNRMRLKNHGKIVHQSTLTAATVPGQGASATVDKIYTVGQAASTRYVAVADVTGFAVNQYVTLHSKDAGDGADHPPVESDGTQETRRIISIDTVNKRLSFDKPLLKEHASGDFVTNGVDIHASIFMGGPAVVLGIGERPTPIIPPKYDDLMMVNRYGWRGFFKFQQFRPEYIQVYETSGSQD